MMISGFVCIMDALGTKGIWRQYVTEDLIEKLESMKRNFEECYSDQVDDVKPDRLKFQLFSDTVIITYDITPEDLRRRQIDPLMLMLYFSWLIVHPFCACLKEGLFLRGAIAQGEFYRGENIIVGPAIDDAYEYYEKARWIGVTCTPSASHSAGYAMALAKKWKKEERIYFAEYLVPMKDGPKISLMALDWPRHFKEEGSLDPKTDDSLQIRRILTSTPIPPAALDIYENTFAFCDESFKRLANPDATEDKNTSLPSGK